MEKSDKLGIITILVLLTAFPLGTIFKPFILISLIGCGFFGLWFWFQSESELELLMYEIEKEHKQKIIKENREHMKRMENPLC